MYKDKSIQGGFAWLVDCFLCDAGGIKAKSMTTNVANRTAVQNMNLGNIMQMGRSY